MNFPKEYKPWMHPRKTPTEEQIDKEIEAGLYDDIYNDPFPFNEYSDGLEDDYSEDSYS